MSQSSDRPRRRTVATRVLVSFAIVTVAFSLVVGWSVVALRNAAAEAVLMRSGYLPLALTLRDAVASQDIWNTQLNHITTAKNPADKRVWFDLALRGGRPKMFTELRQAFTRAFETGDEALRAKGHELSVEASRIEQFLQKDKELLSRLFEALDRRDEKAAERLRERLVARGHQGKKRLSELEDRVQRLVDALIAQARARERLAIRLLIVLSVFTIVVGVAMAWYARRVLAPLAAVTERAKAVARGDLTPRTVVATNDEIGELAQTFENMVRAISKANADLLAAERLATIGKMAAKVTHEIRNPLSSLALNVDLLEEELGAENAEAVALHAAIRNEVERLTALSERYLSVARRKSPSFEEEDLREVCREALDFMRADLERHGVEARLEVDENLTLVRIDEGQIRQALYNLIRNAREAMPNGGVVTVSVRAATDGGVDVTVEDEGRGMDRTERQRLFEPFFTTKGHGTGLGLVITREVVEAHGGSISCEARDGGGTRFWIHLPRRAGKATEAIGAVEDGAEGREAQA